MVCPAFAAQTLRKVHCASRCQKRWIMLQLKKLQTSISKKINKGEKSSMEQLVESKIYQRSKLSPQTEVSLDESLSFFILSGEEGSALGKSSEQAIKYDLGSSFMNKMEGPREIHQLDLNIVGLQFSHHHLFNQEQVLCARLLQLYECFQDRQQQNVSQLLYEKLKALTDATELSNENSEINQLTRKSLQDYYWQISNTKQMYDLERGKDVSLLRSILRTWKQIKSLRQRQGFTSTPIKLQVQRIKMNKCDEQEQISEMSETEKKNEGKELNGKKQESLSYLASDETEIERIKPITLRPQLSFTAELTSLSKCSFMLRNVDARSVPGIPWLINEQKLFEWANEVRIDPNNPEYSDLMEFVMYMRLKGQDIPKYFRLEQLQDEFNFVSEEEMTKSKRFQLLQLRNAGQLDNFLLQQMPLHDTEIPDLLFQEYESQKEKEVSISDVNSITAQRINSANLLKKVRRLIMKRIVKISKYNLSDIVTDYEEIVSTSQLTDAVCQFVEPRRKLKPQRKERKKVRAQTISDGDIKILVRIVRAYNIPTRKTTINRALDMPTCSKSSISCLRHKETIKSVASDEILHEDTVNPFVEVSFQHTVYQTNTASGSHPCWNEEIKVDFISPGHDYSFSSLSKIKDNIYINIFDEMITEKHEDHCLKSCSAHSYIRKNWLGSIVFPFSALLQQSEFLDQTEVLQRAQIFKKNCKAMFPNRRIITTVFNDEGIQFLVTRYIKALNPPQQLLDIFLHNSNATFDLVARFVSLIPFVPNTPDENDGSDIWMTSERCISLAIGNKEEHAILLCNFFLYFGKKALVLLGTSMLEGHVAYVVTQETNEYLLWNPSTGQCYKQFDPFCPLKSIDCLFDDRNVWFNIQQNNTPMAVFFDYSKESFWKELLPKNVQGTKVQSIQPEEIMYFETDKSMVEDLRNRIERTLKSKVMEWRPKHPTRWNRQCTFILRQILPKLEFGIGSFVSCEGDNEFERILQFYWVTGFPIQMPYTDVQSIIDAVYQTGIHSAEFPQTEFALAVYIHPYPNNILSVWVYLASLVPHQ
ncbi:PREDICTED: protein CC2D2B [Cercocebus atys]|nr:PREDICTED: protein CC2D2B [Cercocebus atys]